MATRDALQERLDLARDVAREAGLLLLGVRRDALVVDTKGAQDFVTQADRAVERLIRDRVAARFPNDRVLGEEGGGGDDAERLWVVDPIDGTINFIRGLPAYAISIAYVEHGGTQAGVVHLPLLGEMFYARRGTGAFCNDRRIAVSGCESLDRARIAAGYAQRGSRAEHLGFLERLLHAGTDIVKVNSAAVCLAWVAAGRIDGYFERELMSWDVLAGLLLVEEAGGWTNRFGANGLLGRDVALAAGPGLIDALRALAQA